MIPLMKNTFLNEYETKINLSDFILKSQKLSMGEKCIEFENNFSKHQNCKHSILVNSGASANLIIIQSLLNLGRLKVGDKVGFSTVTWATNVMPIIQLGLIPVPVDCEPSTLNCMSYNLKITNESEKLDAFFITNVLGLSGDLVEIKKYCDDNEIILIEDNCESLGSIVSNEKTGNYGVASSFSFFVAHHLSTIEGGMVCTNDDELSEMLIIVRANGWDRSLSFSQQQKWRNKNNILSEFDAKYSFYDLAYNVRPTEITGFLGLEQLKHLEYNINIRNKNYKKIKEVVDNNDDFIKLDDKHMDFVSSFSMPFICKTPQFREYYIKEFAGAGIEIRPMIAGNMTFQPFFKKYINKKYELKGSDTIHYCGFYCGNYPELLESDLKIIESSLTRK